MPEGKIIAIANQKGGTGKTCTTVNLGIGLANQGKKVLVVDTDPQGDLTTSLGVKDIDDLPITLSTIMGKIIEDIPIKPQEGILHHEEGIDLIPANIELSAMEMSLVTAMSREYVLRNYLRQVKQDYDYILLDCMPSLGMITINALSAADSAIIPVQAHYLPAKGMTQLIKTIGKVKRQLNPQLKMEGILITLVEGRTNLAKSVSTTLREQYGSAVKVFKTEIPKGIAAAETSAEGKSIYAYDKDSSVAKAYEAFTKEVLKDGEKQRHQSEPSLSR